VKNAVVQPHCADAPIEATELPTSKRIQQSHYARRGGKKAVLDRKSGELLSDSSGIAP
jgi:hypothetical protein